MTDICTFAYPPTIPSARCPMCGRCLGCGHAEPYQPWPYQPWPYGQWPYTQPPPVWSAPNTTITYGNLVSHSGSGDVLSLYPATASSPT